MADVFQPKFVDLVRNYTTTTGTDGFLLGPAVNGFESFTDACAVGESFYYSALGVDNPADTEVGRGTLLEGGVIGREPISGHKTNFKSGTKTISLVAAAEWFSQLDWARAGGGPTNVKSFGAKGDGATDDTTAIQAALDHLDSIGGGALYFPEGRYAVSSYLSVPSHTTIRGSGRQSSRIVSAYSGGGGATAGESLRNGSGLITASPINSSSPIHVVIEDIGIENTNPENMGAAYYDTCGTYIAARNVSFVGFKYGVVLDQSELIDFDLCEFAAQNDGGAGVWIVNGPELTPGVLGGFCNRIAIKRSQFNQGALVHGVVDDGGYAHVLEDNNYNGCLHHIRAAGVGSLLIRGGEFESAASDCILLSSATLGGTPTGGGVTAIRGGLYIATSGNASIHGGGSPGSLYVDGLPVFTGGAGTNPITGAHKFAGMWLMSYSNGSSAAAVKDGDATGVNVDCNDAGGFSINGVVCQDGIVTASNVGSAASFAASDFLQAANNLAEIGSATDTARNLRTGYVLAQSAMGVSHTGDTNEFTLASIAIPAAAMGANGRIEVKTRFTLSGAAGGKTLKIKLGGSTIVTATPSASVTSYRINAEAANRNASNSQFTQYETMNHIGSTGIGQGTLAVDTSVAANIDIAGTLANASDTVRLESYQVILYPTA